MEGTRHKQFLSPVQFMMPQVVLQGVLKFMSNNRSLSELIDILCGLHK